MTITLKRLARSDIEFLRVLRNANRHAFFDTRTVTSTDQERWWFRYRDDLRMCWRNTQFYIIWLNRVTQVGFLSIKWVRTIYVAQFPWAHGVCEVGNLLLAPAYRGQGIMAQALTKVRRLYDPMTFWIAHVKPNNTASLRLFERAGFFWAVEPPKGKRKCRTQSKN